MIERIISIRNLGRFADYQARGDVTMRKLTLIYGENGRGKTTLCALFRSLMTGNAAPLQGRQTLGQPDQPAAEIRGNGQNRRLRNGAWTATLPEIAIFDSEFVHQNVYSGDHIAREHRRNSYRVIIGAQGVQFALQIDQLTTDISAASGTIRRSRAQVQGHTEGNTSVEDFMQLAQVEDVDVQIQAKEAEIQAIGRRIQQAVQIQSKGQPQPLTAPALPAGIDDILARTLQDVPAEAEARVKEHSQQHLDANGERWLESGTGYATGDDCPFCGQDLANSDLIALYRSYFNQAYRQLKRDVSTLPDLVAAALRGNAIATIDRTMAANAELMAFWGQFMDLPLPEVSTERLEEVVVNAAAALGVSVETKAGPTGCRFHAGPVASVPRPDGGGAASR